MLFRSARLPVLRSANVLIPIAAIHHSDLTREQRYNWTVLDTFDWYSPRYEKRQDHRRVMALLEESGLSDVQGRAGVVTARRPAHE